MARLASGIKPQNRIDDYLDYVHRQWSGIPALAAEWAQWDEHSKLAFALDWPICEDRLEQLRKWADEGAMNAAQWLRYQELLKLVAKYRSLLDKLLNQEAA